MHLEMMLVLFATLAIMQIVLFKWQQLHKKSFQVSFLNILWIQARIQRCVQPGFTKKSIKLLKCHYLILKSIHIIWDYFFNMHLLSLIKVCEFVWYVVVSLDVHHTGWLVPFHYNMDYFFHPNFTCYLESYKSPNATNYSKVFITCLCHHVLQISAGFCFMYNHVISPKDLTSQKYYKK